MAKCNQLTALPFKGLTVGGCLRFVAIWPTLLVFFSPQILPAATADIRSSGKIFIALSLPARDVIAELSCAFARAGIPARESPHLQRRLTVIGWVNTVLPWRQIVMKLAAIVTVLPASFYSADNVNILLNVFFFCENQQNVCPINFSSACCCRFVPKTKVKLLESTVFFLVYCNVWPTIFICCLKLSLIPFVIIAKYIVLLLVNKFA